MRRIILLAVLLFLGVGCYAQSGVASAQKFPMISIPETITEPAERAKYLGEHYWDNVDFATITESALEEGVVELITLFPLYDEAALKQVWAIAVKRSEGAKGGLLRLLAMCDKYLYGTSSPMYIVSVFPMPLPLHMKRRNVF